MKETARVPNPLSKIDRGARFRWGVGALDKSSDLTGLVAQYIASWSAVDHILNHLMARLLKADVIPVTRIFEQVTSAVACRAARQAIIEATITDDEQMELYTALDRIADTMQGQRHKFVHHLMGVAEGYSKPHLAFVDPKHLAARNAVREEIVRAFERGDDMADVLGRFPANLQVLIPEHVIVYKKGELEKLAAHADEVVTLAWRVMAFLSPPRPRSIQGMPPFARDAVLRRLKNDLGIE